MIYIQSNSERTLPHHFDASCALYGAIDSDMTYRLTTFEEVQSGKFDMLIKSNPFVGSVEFMKEVFKRVGIENVKLPINSNRAHRVMTLGEVRTRCQSGEVLFVKPFDVKLFTGFVMDKMTNNSIRYVTDETPVMVYDVFPSKIASEWRIYVFKEKIVDSRNYSGDFTISPDYSYVEDVISKNNSFPISYTIDVGILESSENVVVEFNDMWAIGNYGMPNDLYMRLLKNRYFQIINK